MKPIAASPVAANAQPLRSVRVRTSGEDQHDPVSTAGIAVGRIAAVVVVVGDDDGPGADAGAEDAAGTASRRAVAAARPRRSPMRAQGQVGRAVSGEHRHHREPGGHRVGAEQVEDVAGEHVRGVERHALRRGWRARPPRGTRRRRCRSCSPTARSPASAALVVLLAPLERDHADDQQHEDQQQRDVEAREQRRVPGREGGEGRAGGDHQPHLVAVPDRADRLEHEAALALVAGEHRQQHADAEVEPLEQEVAAPEERDQRRTRLLKAHVMHLPARLGRRRRRPAALAGRAGPAGVVAHQDEVDDAERGVQQQRTRSGWSRPWRC